jgi:glycine hydroxymethyltransferase
MKHYLPSADKQISMLIDSEAQRQATTLMLIPSENYASKAVEEAVGSPLGNKYAEGYPGRRYYQGQRYVDQIETIAQSRVQEAFGVPYANVQPYSGSPANLEVYFALLKPYDTIMGLTLSHGGHLTHGHPKITASARFFNSVQYQVKPDGFLDYEELEKLAQKHRPKIIIAGTTAYPRTLEFKRFAQIADAIDAYLMADISHISGLVLAGAHPSPVPFAHVITTTTHKTLRGPRGAMILVTQKGLDKNPDLPKKVDSAIIPGLQGGPHINNIAGIAVALKEAATKTFQSYGQQIVKNAKTLAQTLSDNGLNLVTSGTDNHLMVVDVRNLKLLGKDAAVLLETAGIVVNANTVPYDPSPPQNPSGIRLGTPAITSRGMKERQMKQIGYLITLVLKKQISAKQAKAEVEALCTRFPIPNKY